MISKVNQGRSPDQTDIKVALKNAIISLGSYNLCLKRKKKGCIFHGIQTIVRTISSQIWERKRGLTTLRQVKRPPSHETLIVSYIQRFKFIHPNLQSHNVLKVSIHNLTNTNLTLKSPKTACHCMCVPNIYSESKSYGNSFAIIRLLILTRSCYNSRFVVKLCKFMV